MIEQMVRGELNSPKGSVMRFAGRTFTAEELRDGLENLIHPPTPEPEPVVEAEPEPATPKANKTTKTAKRKTGGQVKHL